MTKPSHQHSTTIDTKIAKALAHPVRANILAILNERVASPNEISEELKEPLGNVSYHVRALLNLNCIELVRTAPRRGAIEHYYRAIERPFFSDRDWAQIPRSARAGLSAGLIEKIGDDLTAAVGTSFDRRPDRHLSRTPLALDQQGWDELTEQLAELVENAHRIEAESAERRSGSEEKPIKTLLVGAHFEAAPTKEKPPARRRPASKPRK